MSGDRAEVAVGADQSTDEVTQRKITFVARKWSIPEHEAERMLKNQQARN